jgi:hypothetical protein
VKAICGLWADWIAGEDACGYGPVLALLEIARQKGWKAKLLDYRNSGDTSGNKSGVVGYVAIAFFDSQDAAAQAGRLHHNGNEFTPEQRQFLLKLARKSVAAAVAGGKSPKEEGDVAEKFGAERACFVTLTKRGALRGCIGSILPEEPLQQAVISRAKAAAIDDPRFPPVAAAELKDIDIEVSVLTLPKRLEFATPQDLLEKLRPGVDGVVLRVGRRQATFLPQVWQQLPERRMFLGELCRKAGLPESAWMKPGASVLVYQVEAFKEKKED